MTAEIDRIKKLVQEDQLVAAVELPTSHKSQALATNDLEEALANFDEDGDYAHFVVRVKRSKTPLPKTASAADLEANEAGTQTNFIDSMLNETLELHEARVNAPKATTEYDAAFLMENARLLEESGDYPLARNIYKALIKDGARIPNCLAGIGRTLEKEAKYEAAIDAYREAIAYASEVDFFQSLGALQIKLGKDEEATETLLHALGLAGLTTEQKFEFDKSLGNCYTRLGEYEKAELYYEKAYELNPDSDTLHVNIGSLALQKNDLNAAETHFQKAISINATNDKAMSGMGLVSLAGNDIGRAYSQFLASLRLNLGNLGSIYNLVKCAYELRKFDDAAEILRKYIETNPVNVNIVYSFAGILFHQGNLPASLREVEKILDSNPNHVGARELKEMIETKERSHEQIKG